MRNLKARKNTKNKGNLILVVGRVIKLKMYIESAR
jgi:hypothetical protein